MSDIHILTEGDYEEYTIIGAFTSLKRAEKLAEGTEAHVESYTANRLKLSDRVWRVEMASDGELFDEPICCAWDGEEQQPFGFDCHNSATVTFQVPARSGAHAARIVDKRRKQILAAGAWGSEEHLNDHWGPRRKESSDAK